MDYSTISAARYECIVCHLKTITIAELHRHQTYRHTTEELSLSVIGLRSSLNNGTIKDDCTTYARSWLCDPQKRAEFYAYSASLLNDFNNNANFDRCIPLDCVVRKKESNVEGLSRAKVRTVDRRDDKSKRKHVRSRRTACLHATNSDVLDLSRHKKAQRKPPKSVHKPAHFSGNSEVPEILAKTEKNKLPQDKTIVKTRTPRRCNKIGHSARISEECKDTSAPSEEGKERYKKTKTTHERATEDKKTPSTSRNSREKMKNEGARNDKGILEKDKRTQEKKNNRKRAHSSGASGKLSSISLDKPETLRTQQRDKDSIRVKSRENKKTYSAKKKTLLRRLEPIFDGASVKSVSVFGKIASESEAAEETLPNDYCKDHCNNELCDNVTCLDILEEKPARPENFEILALMIHPQNDMPDVGQEICVDATLSQASTLDPESLHSSMENFEKEKYFPPYPRNMDERSILVVDPETRNLIWTSFELANDSATENDDDLQDVSDLVIVTDDSLDSEKYVATNGESSSICSINSYQESRASEARPKHEDNIRERRKKTASTVASPSPKKSRGKENSSKQDTLERHQPETNGLALALEENSIETPFAVRAKRNRIVPDRYVPY